MIEKEQVLWNVCQEMTKNLRTNAINLGNAKRDNVKPDIPGVFGVFYQGKELGVGLGKGAEADLVFVGVSGDILIHLFDEKTGCSTLRRSLAALLAPRYDLKPIPSSNDELDVDRFENYALDEASETKLTEWMKENLSFGVVAVNPGKDEGFVQAMVDCNAPVFNLRNNKGNQYGAEVKLCRKKCAEQAKTLCVI